MGFLGKFLAATTDRLSPKKRRERRQQSRERQSARKSRREEDISAEDNDELRPPNPPSPMKDDTQRFLFAEESQESAEDAELLGAGTAAGPSPDDDIPYRNGRRGKRTPSTVLAETFEREERALAGGTNGAAGTNGTTNGTASAAAFEKQKQHLALFLPESPSAGSGKSVEVEEREAGDTASPLRASSPARLVGNRGASRSPGSGRGDRDRNGGNGGSSLLLMRQTSNSSSTLGNSSSPSRSLGSPGDPEVMLRAAARLAATAQARKKQLRSNTFTAMEQVQMGGEGVSRRTLSAELGGGTAMSAPAAVLAAERLKGKAEAALAGTRSSPKDELRGNKKDRQDTRDEEMNSVVANEMIADSRSGAEVEVSSKRVEDSSVPKIMGENSWRMIVPKESVPAIAAAAAQQTKPIRGPPSPKVAECLLQSRGEGGSSSAYAVTK